MNKKIIEQNGNKIVIIKGEQPVFETVQEAIDLLATIDYYDNCKKIAFYKEAIPEKLYDLKTGFAGEVLQKFVQYHNQVAIIGDFSKYKSKAFLDFRYECNNGKQIFFVATEEEAIAKLS